MNNKRVAAIALVVLIACGDNLLKDPSFDLWCGGKLCSPWESQGKVERVGTWSSHDFGVGLSDGAALSQLSKHSPVECVELELIADVDANASVRVEMDFQDDGVVEYTELVPESHWARLTYLVNAPDWYQRVRFSVRKQGKGHAVVAQVRATSSDHCDGPELVLRDQPLGASCSSDAQCMTGVCGVAPAHYLESATRASDFEPKQADDRKTCNECASDDDCAADEACDVQLISRGDELTEAARACVPKGEKLLGEWCVTDAACASGLCAQALGLEHGTCGECTQDSECGSGEICGVSVYEAGPARSCHEPEPRKLGELCAADAECGSGVCCGSTCSECCDDAPCDAGADCGTREGFLLVTPALCASQQEARKAGEPCTGNDDCRSGDCKLPEQGCFVSCEGDACGGPHDIDCGFVRQLAEYVGEPMELYRRYGPALVRKARRVLGSSADAQDVVQALFLELLASGKHEGHGIDLSYLYRAVTNRCLSMLRDEKNRARLLAQHSPALRGEARTRCDDEVLGLDLLGKLLAELEPRQSEVVIYRYFDDLSQEEIAELCGASRKTIGKDLEHVRDAVRRLRGEAGAS